MSTPTCLRESGLQRCAACRTVTPVRAQLAETKLPLIPELLGTIESSLSSQASPPSSIGRLSAMLRHVADASALAECIEDPMKRREESQKLDDLQARIWRVHSLLRRRANMATDSTTRGAATSGMQLTLLPLGDSITDGGTKQRSYRYHLHKLFDRNGHNIRWVGSMHGVHDRLVGRNATTGVVVRDALDWPSAAQRHEGHWGWTSRQVLRGHERQPQRGALEDWLERLVTAKELVSDCRADWTATHAHAAAAAA